MNLLGSCGFAGRTPLYDNIQSLSGNYGYVTAPVPNTNTSWALTTGIGNEFTLPWENGNASEFWLHCHIYPGTNDVNNHFHRFGWATGATALGWVSYADTTGLWTIFVNGVQVATAASAITFSAYTTIHVHVVISAVSGVVEVYANDDLTTPILTFSGDTDPTAAVTANRFYGRIPRIGDYMANFAAFENVTDTGKLRRLGILARAPTGDGNYQAWTPDTGVTGYTQIDEAPDVDADYVEATAVGQRSTFTFSTVGTPAQVLGVRWCSRITRSGTDAGSNVQVSRRYSATDYDESAVAAPAAGYVFHNWDTKPGGGDWTAIDVDATEFGVLSAT